MPRSASKKPARGYTSQWHHDTAPWNNLDPPARRRVSASCASSPAALPALLCSMPTSGTSPTQKERFTTCWEQKRFVYGEWYCQEKKKSKQQRVMEALQRLARRELLIGVRRCAQFGIFRSTKVSHKSVLTVVTRLTNRAHFPMSVPLWELTVGKL